MVASADLTLRGTYDRPVLFGHADIERGEVTFEGRRYRITRGTIDFTNPTRIEPFFDVEAETNVRVPGGRPTAYVGVAGTTERLQPTLNSDPPLPTADVLALLFSDVQRTRRGARAARAAESEPDADRHPHGARDAGADAARSRPRSARSSSRPFGVDTFQLTPSFVDPTATDVAPQPDGAADDRQAHFGSRVS